MKNISCSVIATVRNEVETISLFIDSLLSQSISPDEIIIVDGESDDGTNEILQEYYKNNKIILITDNCNISEGRNLAISSATTEFIAATDAGCVIDKNWLQEITKPFRSPVQPDVVAGNYDFDYHNSFEESVILATNNPQRTRSDESKYYPSSRSIAFRKSFWVEAKGYPEWLYAAEDTLFNIRLRQLGAKFVFAENAIVKWRPRTSLKQVGKQFFNYARGNGRIGFSTHGYLLNLKTHAFIIAPITLALIWPWAALLSLFPTYSHIKHNLLPQAKKAGEVSSDKHMLYRVLLIMEYVRLVGMAGFLRGRLDRMLDRSFKENQIAWMGISSIDEEN